MAIRLTIVGGAALLAFVVASLAQAKDISTCKIANEAAEPKWNCYEIYDPTIEPVTIYDAEAVTMSPDNKTVEETYLDRVIESRKDKTLMCATDKKDNINPACIVDPKNRQTINWYWYQYRAPSIYNHMSALAFFDNSWFAAWGANNKKTLTKKEAKRLIKKGEIPKSYRAFPHAAFTEGVAGQRVLLSKSPQKSDSPAGRQEAFREGWSDPDSPHVRPELSAEGAFRQQLLFDPSQPFNPVSNRENPDNRQWQPELLVVDLDPSPEGKREELWAWFTQNLGRGRGTYFARLQHSDQNPDPQWQVRKLDLSKTSLDPKTGFVFVSANSLQLKHQTGATADRNGWVLVPVTPQNETDPDVVNDIAVLYTKDGGETWDAFPRITPAAKFNLWEPVLVESPTTGELFLYVRNRNKKGTPSSEMLIYSSSSDGGETWSEFVPMPLEVPSLRSHAFGLGDRVVLIQHDFENGFSGEEGAREGLRTGRVTDNGPAGGFGNSERINMALFFSRTGKIGSFLPGIAFTTDQQSVRSEENQRGTSYPHMFVIDDTLYTMHSSERSIKGEIISPLPPEDSYLLYPRTTVEIYKKGNKGWDKCPGDDPNVDYKRDKFYESSYCSYRYTNNGNGLGTLTKQASIGVETDTADYAAGEMLQFQFDFTSREPKNKLKKKQRMALLTLGGPDEYGVIEVGRPGHADKVVYVQGGEVVELGDYSYWKDNWGVITVFLYKDGVTLALGDNPPVTIKKPIHWQKIFLGYGYMQGEAYKEHRFNPHGWFRFRSGRIRSRIVEQADLEALLSQL